MGVVQDPYAALAPVYDEWQGRHGPFSDAVLPRLLPLLDGEQPPVRSFVEAGCGTGSLLLELSVRRPQWRLTGADISGAMLARARAKPRAGRITWHELPLDAPVPGGPYDAAGCFFNTMNHLVDRAALDRALAALAAVLRPGGRLIFDVNDAAGYARWWVGHHLYEGPGWRIRTDARYDAGRGQARATLAIQTPGRIARVVVRERLFEHAEIAAALRAAGFGEISSEPWAPTSDGTLGASFWVARRTGTKPGCERS